MGDKRARSIRDPDPPLTVNVESDEAERMYPGLTAEAQGHCVGVSGMMDVPTAQQVRLLARDVTQALFTSSNDQGSNGQGSNDQGSNGQASTSHHAPSVVTVDDPGVSGHDEDDDTGDTRDQAAEIEQLRRFRRNVHTLLRFLVERQTPDLLAVGPLDEIEDYIQRVLTSLLLPLE